VHPIIPTMSDEFTSAEQPVLLPRPFDYDSLEDKALVVELTRIRDEITDSEILIHTTVCKIGEKLAFTRHSLGDKFKRWYEAELPHVRKSTIYNYIRFSEAFASHFPTVGKYRLVDLYAVAGKQCDSFRSELFTRMESGDISNSDELRGEIRAKKASIMKAKIGAPLANEVKSSDITSDLEDKTERAIQLLSVYAEPELIELFSLLDDVSIDRLREQFKRRLRTASLLERP